MRQQKMRGQEEHGEENGEQHGEQHGEEHAAEHDEGHDEGCSGHGYMWFCQAEVSRWRHVEIGKRTPESSECNRRRDWPRTLAGVNHGVYVTAAVI
jgi:hypothetical protein